jgi:hypothetical protein
MRAVFLLSDIEGEPLRSGLKKIPDRACKLLTGFELAERRLRESAQNLDSQGFAGKILKRWHLTKEISIEERLETDLGRLLGWLNILVIV